MGIFQQMFEFSFRDLEEVLFRELQMTFGEIVKGVSLREITTSILFVDITFKRRYYKDAETKRYVYLLDEVLGIDGGISPCLAFGMFMENIKITGYPRNDSSFTDYNEKEIRSINGMIAGGEIEQIRVLDDSDIGGDIYNVLGKYDILITDYSSIYFDYLLTDRPVIFFPFDYEEYVAYDRDLYYDYDLVTPGPKCKTWDEVCEWITRFKEDPSLYKDERAKMKDKFHVYKDGNSSKRVFEEIIQLL